MKLLIDMNLSPTWVPILEKQGWQAIHWISVGPVDAPDVQIMQWARESGYCVVTNDLDFSAILAATRTKDPWVFLQYRNEKYDHLDMRYHWSRNHLPIVDLRCAA
jgi:predicted nuclease of predicted toxin-antitoxin system